MTHRIKTTTGSNLEPVACEKYMSRLLKKEMKNVSKSNSSSQNRKNREEMSKPPSYNAQLMRNKIHVQENIPLKSRKSCGSLIECSGEITTFPPSSAPTKPRSKSAAGHEPWGQLLKSEKVIDRSSIFGTFDPLRTLHFLVKELQFQLKTILPDDNSVLQIVLDMHQALKRVPPEIPSTLNIQKTLEQFPLIQNIPTKPEKLKSTSEKGIQTSSQLIENEQFQKLMIDNSLKLEASCRQMETLCMNLKNEKENLEKQLSFEKENVIYHRKRIEDLESAHDLLKPKIRTLEQQKEELKLEIEKLKINSETKHLTSTNNLASQITDLKNSKTLSEQECAKLKHQLKLSNLEKEKFSTILAVRTQQIDVMKNELLQLHEVISEKFLDLQRNGVKSLPKIESLLKELPIDLENNKENIEDCSLSTIHSDHFIVERQILLDESREYKELPSGDVDVSDNFSLHFPTERHNVLKK